jgi:transcriptional regulator with XRE-family HTH domain
MKIFIDYLNKYIYKMQESLEASMDVSALEIGKEVVRLRELGGIRQAELAAKAGVSPAVLSRIETGDRLVSAEELKRIIRALGNKDAREVLVKCARNWTILERPPLDHPDNELLWSAEQTSLALDKFLQSDAELRPSFRNRVERYRTEIGRIAETVRSRDYQVVLVGKVGIGKSTALCELTNLTVRSEDGSASPVLATGTGRITVCEVQIRNGPAVGISIDPVSMDELRSYVGEFADRFYVVEKDASDPSRSPESVELSEEIERVIRAMSSLTTTKRLIDGKSVRIDRAKQLASEFKDKREFELEVLSRINVPRRDQRDIWFSYESGTNALGWLQKTFANINGGRHPDFLLPKRMVVTIAQEILPSSDLTVSFVDTRGIDELSARTDIERFFDQPRTVVGFCSGFNDAPSEVATFYLSRAKAMGSRNLSLNTFVLVLPHLGQALETKDEDGQRAETVSEGYELKADEAASALQKRDLTDVPIGFFNSRDNDLERGHSFLNERLSLLRGGYREQLKSLTDDAELLMQNFGEAQVQAALQELSAEIKRALVEVQSVGALQGKIGGSVVDQFERRIHPATIRATIRRFGGWYNFDYEYYLGTGARLAVVQTLAPRLRKFGEIVDFIAKNPDFSDSVGLGLISQCKAVLENCYDDLLRKVELLGKEFFRAKLQSDEKFWAAADSQYGPGYREDVKRINEEWFSQANNRKIEADLQALTEEGWMAAVGAVQEMLPSD